MISMILAAEAAAGIAKLGAGLGAGLAAIGAGCRYRYRTHWWQCYGCYGTSARGDEQAVHQHDCCCCSY